MMKISAYQNVSLPEKANSVRPQPAGSRMVGNRVEGSQFQATLDKAVNQSRGVRFSAHAKARLHSRGVNLDATKLEALSNAIDKAEAKGARESLVLSDDAAYVVSIKNRMVITAFDRDNLRDGVFTSIDSAVVL